mgnify:CR=1 FL=1
MNITLEMILAKLPMAKLTETIEAHILPLTRLLPDKRLEAVVVHMILGILGSQTPLVTGMARTNSKAEGESWPVAKRIYRFFIQPAGADGKSVSRIVCDWTTSGRTREPGLPGGGRRSGQERSRMARRSKG